LMAILMIVPTIMFLFTVSDIFFSIGYFFLFIIINLSSLAKSAYLFYIPHSVIVTLTKTKNSTLELMENL
jgi:hypothetical protein